MKKYILSEALLRNIVSNAVTHTLNEYLNSGYYQSEFGDLFDEICDYIQQDKINDDNADEITIDDLRTYFDNTKAYTDIVYDDSEEDAIFDALCDYVESETGLQIVSLYSSEFYDNDGNWDPID